jgi:pimeloyl-ACP methyl ester carboxylesterase
MNAPKHDPIPRDEPDLWARFGRGVAVSGRAVGRAAGRVGKAVSSAYLAVDPDVRRHVGQLPLLGLTLLSPARDEVEPMEDDGARPIVFVHGLGGHRGNFLPMRAFLALCGRKRTYAIALDSSKPMEESAEDLRRFIDELFEKNALLPGSQIDVVGHSMGGLVARLAIDDEVTRSRVHTLVTLGTPHSGTYAARYGATRNLLDLRPDSAVMQRLRRQLPWRGAPTMPRLVSLWSKADVFLLPPEAGCAEGAESIEMPRFTHYSYLLLPMAWERVESVLSRSGAPNHELHAGPS